MKRRGRGFRLALWALVAIHAAVLGADLLAPCDPAAQDRAFPFAPPTRLHWFDAEGGFHLRPFVYRWVERPGSLGEYLEDRSRRYPLRLWVAGEPRRLLGLVETRRRLVGVEAPARLFLFGTDGYGRDQLSRLLYGGRVSLFSGLLAAALSVLLGLAVGAVAGYYGGWIDDLLMRGTELMLALPWLYLLLAVRAFLPLDVEPVEAFLLLIGLIGVVGAARPARLVRGVALSARNRNFVLAARGFGASDLYLLRRHVLPQTLGVATTQLTLLIPQYVLAEVTLSFLGLGVGEPAASWGNMLAVLQRYHVVVSYRWMFIPAFALVVVVMAYQVLAGVLHQRRKTVAF